MSREYRPAFVIVATAALLPLSAVGVAQADPPPTGVGDPALWGPPMQTLCDDLARAAQLGDDVIEGDFGNVLVGTLAADALDGCGGNDTVDGSGGDDLACGGYGLDRIDGEAGNDAVFGEAHDDPWRGAKGRDHLDGGTRTDSGNGGDARDAGAGLESAVPIP